MDCAVEAKIIEKAGSWYSFEGNRIGQGRENVKKYLEENPQILDKVEGLLLDTLKKDKEKNAAEADMKIPGIDEDIVIDEDGVIIE